MSNGIFITGISGLSHFQVFLTFPNLFSRFTCILRKMNNLHRDKLLSGILDLGEIFRIFSDLKYQNLAFFFIDL